MFQLLSTSHDGVVLRPQNIEDYLKKSDRNITGLLISPCSAPCCSDIYDSRRQCPVILQPFRLNAGLRGCSEEFLSGWKRRGTGSLLAYLAPIRLANGIDVAAVLL